MEEFFHPFKDSPKKKKKKSKQKEKLVTRAPAIPSNFVLRGKRKPPPEVIISDDEEQESEDESRVSKRERSDSESESEFAPPPPPKKRKKTKMKNSAYREVKPSPNTVGVFHGSKWFIKQIRKDKYIARDCLEALAVYLPKDFEKLKSLDRAGMLRLKYGVYDAYGSAEETVDFEEEEDSDFRQTQAIMDLSGAAAKVQRSSGQVFEQYLMSDAQLAHYKPFFSDLKRNQIAMSLANTNQEWLQTLLSKFLNYAFHYLVYKQDGIPFSNEVLFERCTGYKIDGFVKKFRHILFFAIIAYAAAKHLVSQFPNNPRALATGKKDQKEVTNRIRSVLAQENREEEMPERLFYKMFPKFKQKSGFWISAESEESDVDAPAKEEKAKSPKPKVKPLKPKKLVKEKPKKPKPKKPVKKKVKAKRNQAPSKTRSSTRRRKTR